MVGFFFVSLFSVHECVSGSLAAVCLGFCCHRECCFVVAQAFWGGRGGCALEKENPGLPLSFPWASTLLPCHCSVPALCWHRALQGTRWAELWYWCDHDNLMSWLQTQTPHSSLTQLYPVFKMVWFLLTAWLEIFKDWWVLNCSNLQ